MAAALMDEHQLLTLKITFRYTANPPELVLDLLVGGRNVPDARWRINAQLAGVPTRVGPSSDFKLRLPSSTLMSIVDCIAALPLSDKPLWLLFAQPSGFVGGMTWEEELGPALGSRPILRLPDFLERQRENRSTLEVALILDVPEEKEVFPIPEIAANLAVWAAASPRRRTQVRIFASKTWYPRVRAATSDSDQMSVVPPPSPTIFDKETEAEREVTWLDWIARESEGHSVDVLHFVSPGYFSRSQPTLALTCSPARARSEASAAYLSPIEAAQFLTRIGAWATVCSAPPSGMAAPVRAFADSLAQSKPGPVLFHDMQKPNWVSSLQQWIPFLFAAEASSPPHAAGGFAYCQPALVAGADYTALSRMTSGDSDQLATTPDVSEEQTDTWLSAALRSRERAVVNQLRWAQEPQADKSAMSSGPRSSQVLSETIREFDEILRRHATPKSRPQDLTFTSANLPRSDQEPIT